MLPNMEAMQAIGNMLNRAVVALESIAESLAALAAVHGGGRPLPSSVMQDERYNAEGEMPGE